MGETVAQDLVSQGRAGIRGLLIVSGLLMWLLIESSPNPVSTARTLVDSLLLISDREQDPLLALPGHLRKPLSQYRYEFKHVAVDASAIDDKTEALRQIPVEAVLQLGKHALIDAPEEHALAEIYEAGNRNRLGELESLFSVTGLSEYSTLGALQDQVENRIQLPIIEQSVSGRSLLTVLAIAIICLNGYLTSVCATARSLLNAELAGELRPWMPMHLHSFGFTMSIFAVLLPSCLWTIEKVLTPVMTWQSDLSFPALLISLLLMISGALSVRELLKLRKKVEWFGTNNRSAKSIANPAKLAA